jgi:hypothetical protein
MPKEINEGDKSCLNYKGIIRVDKRICCGGKERNIVTIGCQVHRQIKSHNCRKSCEYYEEGGTRE